MSETALLCFNHPLSPISSFPQGHHRLDVGDPPALSPFPPPPARPGFPEGQRCAGSSPPRVADATHPPRSLRPALHSVIPHPSSRPASTTHILSPHLAALCSPALPTPTPLGDAESLEPPARIVKGNAMRRLPTMARHHRRVGVGSESPDDAADAPTQLNMSCRSRPDDHIHDVGKSPRSRTRGGKDETSAPIAFASTGVASARATAPPVPNTTADAKGILARPHRWRIMLRRRGSLNEILHRRRCHCVMRAAFAAVSRSRTERGRDRASAGR